MTKKESGLITPQNAKEMAAIKKYLETQNVTIKPTNHPLVGGVEIDLPALYHAVQNFGGLTEVIQVPTFIHFRTS
jgi:hypothetical protein